MKYKVIIVDDQYIARELFEYYIKSSENYELENSLESAILVESYLERHSCDLLIMDILMADGSNGLLEAIKVKRKYPNLKIIMITSMAEASWLKRAKEAGIDSFWYKEISKETILEVIDRTMNGESVYPDSAPSIKIGHAYSHEFTDKELEVLRLMTKGLSNGQIALKLYISENTVKTHIQHMLDKTGCANRTELAILARVNGIAIDIDND